MSLLRLLKQTRQQRNRGRRPQSARTPLFLEPLEHRITPDVTLNNGHLGVNSESIEGLVQDLDIDVNNSLGVSVTMQGKVFAFGANQVSSIEVNLHSFYICERE